MSNQYGNMSIVSARDGSLVFCVDGSSVDPTYGNFNDNDLVTEFSNLQPNGSTGEETLEIGETQEETVSQEGNDFEYEKKRLKMIQLI